MQEMASMLRTNESLLTLDFSGPDENNGNLAVQIHALLSRNVSSFLRTIAAVCLWAILIRASHEVQRALSACVCAYGSAYVFVFLYALIYRRPLDLCAGDSRASARACLGACAHTRRFPSASVRVSTATSGCLSTSVVIPVLYSTALSILIAAIPLSLL
eukprot:5429623-Pleurochrysis_carterae.AAC.1